MFWGIAKTLACVDYGGFNRKIITFGSDSGVQLSVKAIVVVNT